MPKASQKKIVEDQLLFRDEDIRATIINENYITKIFTVERLANEFLAKCKLIINYNWCDKCEGSPRLSYIKDVSAIDGFRWRCKRPCTVSKTIREGNFFEECKYSFNEIFKILCKYMKGEMLKILHLRQIEIAESSVSFLNWLVKQFAFMLVSTVKELVGEI